LYMLHTVLLLQNKHFICLSLLLFISHFWNFSAVICYVKWSVFLKKKKRVNERHNELNPCIYIYTTIHKTSWYMIWCAVR
jgi:hypothetical protein